MDWLDKIKAFLLLGVIVAGVCMMWPHLSLFPTKVSAEGWVAGNIPLCSSGKTVELDLEDLKEKYPEEYDKLPFAVKGLGFGMKACKPDQ